MKYLIELSFLPIIMDAKQLATYLQAELNSLSIFFRKYFK